MAKATIKSSVLKALQVGPMGPDGLEAVTAIPLAKIHSALNRLEAEGKVYLLSGLEPNVSVAYALEGVADVADQERRARMLWYHRRSTQARNEADKLRADARELSDDADRLAALAAELETKP